MTAAEASFVALDQPRTPMHIAALLLLEGPQPLRTGDLQRLVSTKLRRVSRFRQRVRWPFGGRRPVWEPVGRIKPGEHFFTHRLPPQARESDLLALCAKIHQAPLSYERPLWEMHL